MSQSSILAAPRRRPLTRRLAARLAVWLGLIAAAAMLASGCDLFSTDDEDDQEQEQAQVLTPAQRAAAAQPLSYVKTPAEIFELVRPSLALVRTATGAATGLVTDQGMILVGLTQLGGALAADVSLADGSYLEGVPLASANPLADIAMLGPIERRLAQSLPGSPLGDGERLAVGAPIYAFGYAKGATLDPLFAGGLLAKRVQWTSANLTLLGADINLADDQAGVVLVDATAQVIGIASRSLADAGTFISAVDLAQSGRPAASAAQRPAAPGAAALAVAVDLRAGQTRAWETQSVVEQPLSLTIEGTDLGEIAVEHLDGTLLMYREIGAGREQLNVPLSTPGRLRISLTAPSDGPASFDLQSSTPLLLGNAPSPSEAARALPLLPGQPQIGFSFPGLVARPYQLLVGRGTQYQIRAESISCDVDLGIDGVPAAVIDDAIGGAGRGDAVALIRAFANAQAMISVSCADGGAGAFILAIEQSELTADTAIVADLGLNRDLPPIPDLPALAMRGSDALTPDGARFAPEFATEGFSTPQADIIFDDGDGSFEIRAYIIGASGTSARINVVDGAGTSVFSGRVATACADANPCRGSANFLVPRSQPGRYLANLQPEAGEPTAWQVEIYRGR